MPPSHTEAVELLRNLGVLQGNIVTQTIAIELLRDALSLTEAVYRLNVVKDGESSSTLDNMQLILAATASIAPTSEPVTREGWQCVPVEPTPYMMAAGANASTGKAAIDSYRAMLAAAPTPPAPQAPWFKRETAPSCPLCCAKKGEPHTAKCTESGIA